MGEMMVEVVVCEMFEEVGVCVEVQNLFMLFNVLYVYQVYLFYFVWFIDLVFEVGEESFEVKLFDEVDILWDEIVFLIVSQMLCFFFVDCVVGDYGVYIGDIFCLLCNG